MNVTPLLDLAFVLLIIFVIASPFLSQSAALDVSTGDEARRPEDPSRAVTVSISATRTLQLEGRPVTEAELGPALAGRREDHSGEGELGVRVEAHRDLAVHDLLDVMTQIKSAGITRVGVVAQSDTATATATRP